MLHNPPEAVIREVAWGFLFIYRLIQDKMYGDSRISPYNDIVRLMLFDAIPFDNIYVLRCYAVLMWKLTAISNINQCLVYIEILEKIYHAHLSDKDIACSYAKELANFIYKEKSPEQKEIIDKLRYLSELHIDNLDIQTIYEEVIEFVKISNRVN